VVLGPCRFLTKSVELHYCCVGVFSICCVLNICLGVYSDASSRGSILGLAVVRQGSCRIILGLGSAQGFLWFFLSRVCPVFWGMVSVVSACFLRCSRPIYGSRLHFSSLASYVHLEQALNKIWLFRKEEKSIL